MKPIYVTAAVTFSGKTALLLGIGLKLQSMGRKVGYLKPVSTQPFILNGKLVDEDAEFVRRSLGLEMPTSELAPVIVDDALLDGLMDGSIKRDFAAEVRSAYERVSQGKDVMLLEGAASLREGYVVGLNASTVAEMLGLPIIGVVRYRTNVMLVDDVLTMRGRVGDKLAGVVFNNVSAEAMDVVRGKIAPYLEKQGVRVYGVLPHEQALMSMSVDELADILGARRLNRVTGEALIENLAVGAMTVESAVPHFRRMQHKAVITGGDRADIQAAALDTSTAALVLTGNLQPSSTILRHADEQGVAVLMVPYTTIETVEKVENVFGRTRLAHPEKLNHFRATLDEYLNWSRLLEDLGL